MKKFFYSIVVVTVLAGVFTAHAQTLDQDKAITYADNDQVTSSNWAGKWMNHNIAGVFGVQVTYRHTNLDQINSALLSNGIPKLRNSDIWINLTQDHIHNKWIFEDGLGATPLTESDNGNIKAKFGQAQAYFRAGYDITKNSPFRFFPFAGLNFTGAMLRIQDYARTNAAATFNSEILNSTSSKTFYQGNFGIELGAGFDYLIKLKSKSMDCVTIERNIPIGIRAGYYINASQSNWKVDDHSLTNSPDKKQSAVFVSLNIGLGYNVHK